MNTFVTVTGIALIVMAVFLVIAVLMQSSKDRRSGATIAGGAETFFGKNKGRTIDAVLKKATSVIAALFIISSVTLALVTVNEGKAKVETTEGAESPAGETQQVTVDEDGNLVDSEGNVIMTAEQMAEQEAQAEAEGETAEADAEEAPVEAETAEAEATEAPAEGEAKAE